MKFLSKDKLKNYENPKYNKIKKNKKKLKKIKDIKIFNKKILVKFKINKIEKY